MGHDIYAIIPGADKVITHLRIGGRKRRATHLYRALNAEQYNAKDSGTGEKAQFTLDQLKKAERSSEITVTEHIFLQKCIGCGKDKVEILFS